MLNLGGTLKHMWIYMVRHQVVLDKFNASLPAQILYYLPYPFAKLTIQLLFTVLRNNHHMVFAFPSDMR